MNDSPKYRCVNCTGTDFKKHPAFWQCTSCKAEFSCFNGIPRLYNESAIGKRDKWLRNHFYNSLLGKYYQFLMPFLTLPARPFERSKKDWVIYFATIGIAILLIYKNILIFTEPEAFTEPGRSIVNGFYSLALVLVLWFFIRQPHFLFLFILAAPVKISLIKKKYNPKQSFQQIHQQYLDLFNADKHDVLQVLDISTGTGNSLYRHGWMKLKAEYTALDLSETMLAQCQKFMEQKKIPVDLVMADAASLPFTDNYFDIVLNYGAVNGYSDIKRSLQEMARVTKTGGLIFFLDEQLYAGASAIEKIYFKKVLSSHNNIHRCPVELLPACIGESHVYQVYEFYYICVGQKKSEV